MADKRIIRVTGKGHVKATPNMTRINMKIEGWCPEYSDTVKLSTKDTEALKDLLEKLGFERKQVKTTYFSIDSKYEYYQNEKGENESRFVGFEYYHRMKIEFDSDNDRLGTIVYALANNDSIMPEFDLVFFVKDGEGTKNLLLERAVADAKRKAEVLAKAAEVALKDIQSIDYSWGEIKLDCNPVHGRYFMDCIEEGAPSGSYNMDIEPDDIDVSDTVTVIWEIG